MSLSIALIKEIFAKSETAPRKMPNDVINDLVLFEKISMKQSCVFVVSNRSSLINDT
jgi:hypothetical protein